MFFPVRSFRHQSFTLDEDRALEGSWMNGPILPETDRFLSRRKASYMWRANTGRHPYLELPSVKGLPLDSFSVSVWLKIDMGSKGGIAWDLNCGNCVSKCPASARLAITQQGAHVFVVPTDHDADSNLCGTRAQRPRIVNTITRLITGTWRHVVVRLDAGRGIFDIFVDGRRDGFVEGVVRYDTLAGRKVGNMVLGRQFFKGRGAMPAAYDDLQVWDHAISEEKIRSISQVDCVFTTWSAWGACTANPSPGGSVQIATRKRTRKISLHPLNGGKAFPAVLEESQECDMKSYL